MDYLTDEVAHFYLYCSVHSLMHGLITDVKHLAHCDALRSMCAPDHPYRRSEAELWNDDWCDERRTLEGEYVLDAEQQNDRSVGESTGDLRNASDDIKENRSHCFQPAHQTGLQKWVFHPYDDDYFPSVPHGHWTGLEKQKLDPYLGWIYGDAGCGKQLKPVAREPRRGIILLWNDDEFRKIALAAINYYIQQYPRYRGWRVEDPKQLPRRRKR